MNALNNWMRRESTRRSRLAKAKQALGCLVLLALACCVVYLLARAARLGWQS